MTASVKVRQTLKVHTSYNFMCAERFKIPSGGFFSSSLLPNPLSSLQLICCLKISSKCLDDDLENYEQTSESDMESQESIEVLEKAENIKVEGTH